MKKYCKNCGKKYGAKNKFCPLCGEKLSSFDFDFRKEFEPYLKGTKLTLVGDEDDGFYISESYSLDLDKISDFSKYRNKVNKASLRLVKNFSENKPSFLNFYWYLIDGSEGIYLDLTVRFSKNERLFQHALRLPINNKTLSLIAPLVNESSFFLRIEDVISEKKSLKDALKVRKIKLSQVDKLEKFILSLKSTEKEE